MKANARLTIQTKTGGGNFGDDPPEQWDDFRVEKFLLTSLSAREYVAAQQLQSSVTHRAECPWFAGANSEMRLVTADESRVFQVESVMNREERNRVLDWVLVEVNG